MTSMCLHSAFMSYWTIVTPSQGCECICLMVQLINTGVSVHMACPGFVNTAMIRQAQKEAVSQPNTTWRIPTTICFGSVLNASVLQDPDALGRISNACMWLAQSETVKKLKAAFVPAMMTAEEVMSHSEKPVLYVTNGSYMLEMSVVAQACTTFQAPHSSI